MWKIDYAPKPVDDRLPKKWILRYMNAATYFASWSKEWRTKVGAVIVNSDKRLISPGYNGFPKGMEDKEEWYKDSDFKRKHVIHAETNAILNALAIGADVKGGSIFITHPPCPHCIGMIVQSGIKYCYYKVPEGDFVERWPIQETLDQLARVGLETYEVKGESILKVKPK